MNRCLLEVKYTDVYEHFYFFFMHWSIKNNLKWAVVSGRYQHMSPALNWSSLFFSVSLVTDPRPQPRFAGRFGPPHHKPAGRQFVWGTSIHCHGNLHRRVPRMLSHHDMHEGKICINFSCLCMEKIICHFHVNKDALICESNETHSKVCIVLHIFI